jgi:Fe2+ or Zn2+ uptake regulation protein
VVAPGLHDVASVRLAAGDQRYTPLRRALVATLADAGRPLAVPELLEAIPHLALSSAYRNIATLVDVGVVRRVLGTDERARFELAEALSSHHHHVTCERCGAVEDVAPSPRLERAVVEAAGVAAEELGYVVRAHRFDLVGVCPRCARAAEGAPGEGVGSAP